MIAVNMIFFYFVAWYIYRFMCRCIYLVIILITLQKVILYLMH